LATHGAEFARPTRLISNGAYRLSEWRVQSHIRLDRNEHYWNRDQVQIDTVMYYPTEDLSSELKRYRADELDFTDEIPNEQFRWVKKNLGGELHVAPYLSSYFYAFDTTQPPFDAPGLRQALSMAVDRHILTEIVTGMGQIPAYSLVPEGVAAYQAQAYEWADLDDAARRAEARRLFKAAGFSPENPLQVEIAYNTSENHKKIALAIAAMWKDVLGVEVTLLNQEWKVYLQTRKDPDQWAIMRFGWSGDYNDANAFLEILRRGHAQNLTGFASDAYDALLDEAAAAGADPARRQTLLAQAERLMLNNYPIIPLYFYVSKHLVKPRVQGFRTNIMDHNYSRHYSIQGP
jgi:oligopeptide transport system substrate-binding protein